MVGGLFSLFNRESDDLEIFRKEEFLDTNNTIDELFYRVDAGSVVLLHGKTGKTITLFQIIKRFRGKKKVIYLDCRRLKKALNIEDLLYERYGKLNKVFRIKPKKMILLLDNVGHLSCKNIERIKYLYDTDYLKSIVITSATAKNLSSPSIMHRIGRRVYHTPKIKASQLLEISAKHVKSEKLKSIGFLMSVFESSQNSVTRFKKNLKKLDSHLKKNPGATEEKLITIAGSDD